MRPACSIKKVFAAVLLGFSVCGNLSGCLSKSSETFTLGEWITLLDEEAGIYAYQNDQPYYADVPFGSSYYDAVQAAVEWGVLEPSDEFDPDVDLSRQWAAHTLFNLSALGKTDNNLDVKDIGDAMFASDIENAVSWGILAVKENGLFYPEEIIGKEEAEKALAYVVDLINNREMEEDITEIKWSDEENIITIDPLSLDDDLLSATVDNFNISIGDNVAFQSDEGFYVLREVTDVHDSGNIRKLSFVEADIVNLAKTMKISGTSDISFDNAEIITSDGDEYAKASLFATKDTAALLLASAAKQKTYDLSGFKLRIEQSGATLSATLYKELTNGTEISAKAKVNGVKASYEWNWENGGLNSAYFKIKAVTTESISASNGAYKNLYGDFSRVESDNFLASLQSMFVKKKDVLEQTLTICTIRVPIPNAPLLTLNMSLEMHMHVSGKVELSFSQTHTIGLEYKNGNLRAIKEYESSHRNKIKATAELTASVRFALACAAVQLMDTGIEAGGKAEVSTQVHLYDTDGNHTVVSTDISADVIDEMADGNPDVLVCTDINAYAVLKLKLNTKKTILGKMGLTATFEILGKDNANIIPGSSRHFENFQQVEKCTRNSRIQSTAASSFEVEGQIVIDCYAMVIEVGDTDLINIISMPEGYGYSDVVYKSSSTSVAKVDSNGFITAISEGSAIITVATSDGKHAIQCTVLVPTN